MNPRTIVCLGLLNLAFGSAGFSQSVPKLDQVLPRVHEHVKDFEILFRTLSATRRLRPGN